MQTSTRTSRAAPSRMRASVIIMAVVVFFSLCVGAINLLNDNGLQEEITALKGDVTALNDRLNALGNVDALAVKRDIKALQEQVSALTDADGTMGSDVAALKQKVATLSPVDVSALSAELSAMKDWKTTTPAPPVVKVSSFNLTKESESGTDGYLGEGTLSCNSTEPYLIVMRYKLKSGGSSSTPATDIWFIEVANGKGVFTTYDYGPTGTLQKPDYQFEIIGYIRAESISGS